MMWRCECCGATFDEPVSQTVKENLDGENGWWESIEMYCPVCFEGDCIYEQEETPSTLEDW